MPKILAMLSIAFALSSGVGGREGGPFDGIGQLRNKLARLPGVTVFLNRLADDWHRMDKSVREMADQLDGFDRVCMAGHSRGVEYELDVARASGLPVYWFGSSDGWTAANCLECPANVVTLESWTQDRFHPQGKPIIVSPATHWVKHPPLTNVKHRRMSSLAAFHAAAIAAASQS